MLRTAITMLARPRTYTNNMQVLAEQLQLDSEIDTSDLVSKATSLLGAKPIVTCFYRHGKAYLDSVSIAF